MGTCLAKPKTGFAAAPLGLALSENVMVESLKAIQVVDMVTAKAKLKRKGKDLECDLTAWRDSEPACYLKVISCAAFSGKTIETFFISQASAKSARVDGAILEITIIGDKTEFEFLFSNSSEPKRWRTFFHDYALENILSGTVNNSNSSTSKEVEGSVSIQPEKSDLKNGWSVFLEPVPSTQSQTKIIFIALMLWSLRFLALQCMTDLCIYSLESAEPFFSVSGHVPRSPLQEIYYIASSPASSFIADNAMLALPVLMVLFISGTSLGREFLATPDGSHLLRYLERPASYFAMCLGGCILVDSLFVLFAQGYPYQFFARAMIGSSLLIGASFKLDWIDQNRLGDHHLQAFSFFLVASIGADLLSLTGPTWISGLKLLAFLFSFRSGLSNLSWPWFAICKKVWVMARSAEQTVISPFFQMVRRVVESIAFEDSRACLFIRTIISMYILFGVIVGVWESQQKAESTIGRMMNSLTNVASQTVFASFMVDFANIFGPSSTFTAAVARGVPVPRFLLLPMYLINFIARLNVVSITLTFIVASIWVVYVFGYHTWEGPLKGTLDLAHRKMADLSAWVLERAIILLANGRWKQVGIFVSFFNGVVFIHSLSLASERMMVHHDSEYNIFDIIGFMLGSWTCFLVMIAVATNTEYESVSSGSSVLDFVELGIFTTFQTILSNAMGFLSQIDELGLIKLILRMQRSVSSVVEGLKETCHSIWKNPKVPFYASLSIIAVQIAVYGGWTPIPIWIAPISSAIKVAELINSWTLGLLKDLLVSCGRFTWDMFAAITGSKMKANVTCSPYLGYFVWAFVSVSTSFAKSIHMKVLVHLTCFTLSSAFFSFSSIVSDIASMAIRTAWLFGWLVVTFNRFRNDVKSRES